MESEINAEEAPMYLWAGRALCEAQHLESTLKNLIVIIQMARGDTANVPSLVEVFESHDSKTLGRLLKTVQKYVRLEPEFKLKLQHALDRRNALVHRYFVDAVVAHGYLGVRQVAPRELRQLAEQLSVVADEVLEVTIEFGSALGMTPDLLNSHLRKLGADFEVQWPSN